MPIYESECLKCKTRHEYFSVVDQCEISMPHCCNEQTAKRIFSAPSPIPDIQPYRSMVDGSMITSRSEHKNHLKKHGVIEVGNETMSQPKPDLVAKKKQDFETRKIIYDKLTALENNV